MVILVLINNDMGLYRFRRELLQQLLKESNEVYIGLPYGEFVDKLTEDGCQFIDLPIDRRGMSIIKDICLLKKYLDVIRKIKPDLVLTYTIKPNLYGGLACRLTKTKVIHTVTGLGSIYINNLPIKRMIICMNRLAFRKSQRVFFLNQDNEIFYRSNKIISANQKTEIVHGSGVNIVNFPYAKLTKKPDEFLMVARIIKDKGICEYISAARNIKQKHPEIQFHLIGFYDDIIYRKLVEEAVSDGIINYHGVQKNVYQFYQQSTCVVLPSYGEGNGTVLLEGASTGRPLITCDTFGCRDNVIEGVNGYLCKPRDSESLRLCLEKFISLPFEEKLNLADNSRQMAENRFNRKLVTEAYCNIIRTFNKRD